MNTYRCELKTKKIKNIKLKTLEHFESTNYQITTELYDNLHAEIFRVAVDMKFPIHIHIHIHRFCVDIHGYIHIHRCLSCIDGEPVNSSHGQLVTP